MRMFRVFLISAGSFAFRVLATSVAPRSPIHQVFARQSGLDPSSIPSACTDRCSNLESTIQECATSTSPSCGCSTTQEAGFVDCLNCIIGTASGVPTQAQLQSVQAEVDRKLHLVFFHFLSVIWNFSEYIEACAAAGVDLPATTISGVVSGITSTPVGNTATSTLVVPAITSSTGVVTADGSQTTVAVLPSASPNTVTVGGGHTTVVAATPTSSQSSNGGGSGLSGKNSASRTRGQEVAMAAAAVVLVSVVFF
ncbi:hypothetical protein H0H92_009545 [Tricholoma furcatifolium]|nr:hypothetical protein H0H92_009545 [Tricholoma furcatifolium]